MVRVRNTDRSWLTFLYRLWWADGYSWRFALGLGIATGAAGIFVAFGITRLPHDIATSTQLVTIADEVIQIDAERYETFVRLKQHPQRFSYPDAFGEREVVNAAIRPGQAIEISVDKHDFFVSGARPSYRISILALSVGGRPIRSYEQIATALDANNRGLLNLAPIVFVAFLLIAAAFFATARHEWRRERGLL